RYLELDECLRNPSKWAADKHSGISRGYPPGYDYWLREGIFHFHKNKDPLKAKEHLLQSLIRRDLQNGIRIGDLKGKFDAYVAWFNDSKVTVAAHRFTLSYDLGNGIVLGGTVSRVDMMPSGYRAILLSHAPNNWEQQIHMPLI